jgi:hypothetical protein
MNGNKMNGLTMRVLHRYLGFFLAGIMAVYAVSGIVMIFRNTDFLKQDVRFEKQIGPGVQAADLGTALELKKLKVDKEADGILYFKEGTYNSRSGEAVYTLKELPLILNKMTQMHKATTKDPLYYLNIFFGLSLLFFVVSAFWMFLPSTSVFRKGLYFTLAGIVLTLIMLFV